jgi:adenylate kinase
LVVLLILDQRLQANPEVNGFVLDRFPETLLDCNALDVFLEDNGEVISKIIHLELDENTLLKRQPNMEPIAHLVSKEGLRKFHRLCEAYKKDLLPIYNHYAANGLATKVWAEGSIDKVFANLCSVVDKLV